MTPEERFEKLKSGTGTFRSQYRDDEQRRVCTPIIENEDILAALRECRVDALEEAAQIANIEFKQAVADQAEAFRHDDFGTTVKREVEAVEARLIEIKIRALKAKE